MATCERARPRQALLIAESVSVHAAHAVVGAADFAGRGRTCPLGMTQRHEQPVADGQPRGNIADYPRPIALAVTFMVARRISIRPGCRQRTADRPVGYEPRREPGAHLAAQEDGNMVIYQGSSLLWAPSTGD